MNDSVEFESVLNERDWLIDEVDRLGTENQRLRGLLKTLCIVARELSERFSELYESDRVVCCYNSAITVERVVTDTRASLESK